MPDEKLCKILYKNLGVIDCEKRNLKEQWDMFKKCLLTAVCDVLGRLRGQQGRHGLHRK
jgi:hypothetical protein